MGWEGQMKPLAARFPQACQYTRPLPGLLALAAALLWSAQPALAQFTQQGPKLIGTGAVVAAAGGGVALRLEARTGFRRGKALQGLPQTPGLGLG